MEIIRPRSKQFRPENAKKVFEGVIFDVYQWEQKMFDGSFATFEQLERSDSVTVFPVLPGGMIMLNKEEQPGRPPFVCAPGGQIDDGEDVISAAKRELLEETGYEAENFVLWSAAHPYAKIDWVVYTFVAKGLRRVATLSLDPGEKIEPKIVSFDELVEIGASGNMREKEVSFKLLEAKYDPDKKEELRKLFDPNI